MSLAIAIWESPESYVLAADSRLTRDIAGPADDCGTKVHRFGPWLVAWVGGMPGGVRLVRELGRALANPETTDIDAALQAAFDATVERCGPTPSGEYPRTGATLLVVGPAGIAEMDSTGAIVWERSTPGVDLTVRTVGCAKDYALGFIDGAGADSETDIAAFAGLVIKQAAAVFPAVGGPVVVLRGPA